MPNLFSGVGDSSYSGFQIFILFVGKCKNMFFSLRSTVAPQLWYSEFETLAGFLYQSVQHLFHLFNRKYQLWLLKITILIFDTQTPVFSILKRYYIILNFNSFLSFTHLLLHFIYIYANFIYQLSEATPII